MFSGNSFIVYVVLAAIAIVAVVTIVIPPLLDVSGDWTLTRAMNVLREYGYTAFADTEGNLSIGGNLDVGGVITGDGSGITGIPGTSTPSLQAVTDVGNSTTTGIQLANTGTFPLTLTQSGTTVFRLWDTGHVTTLQGYDTESPLYGPGHVVYAHGDSTPVRADGTGEYDHTGNAAGESIFTITSGTTFSATDGGQWIVLWGTDFGAYAEIKTIISGTQAQVDGMGWDKDFVDQVYYLFNHPIFTTGDGAKTAFSVNGDGEFEVVGYDFTGEQVVEVENNAGTKSTRAVTIQLNAEGHTGSLGQRINVSTGDLSNGENATGASILINDTAAVSSGTDTTLVGHAVITTNTSDAEQIGYAVLPGFDAALRVFGATGTLTQYGYEVTSGSVSQRAVAPNDQFRNPASNVSIFDSNADYILLGSDATFEILEVVLDTGSSKSIQPNFYYSKAGGNWTLFVPDADNTVGFQSSGQVLFDAPGDWSKDDQAEVNGDITEAYYIKIERTYAPVIPTIPVESYFNTYDYQSTGMQIRGDGVVVLPYLAGVPNYPTNGCIWMEADGLHIYYGGVEKVVAGS